MQTQETIEQWLAEVRAFRSSRTRDLACRRWSETAIVEYVLTCVLGLRRPPHNQAPLEILQATGCGCDRCKADDQTEAKGRKARAATKTPRHEEDRSRGVRKRKVRK